jgi:polyisoprenoid-binding protein YceI
MWRAPPGGMFSGANVAFPLAAVVLGASEGSKTFLVNAKESVIYVVVKKDPSTLLSGAGRDHVVRATRIEGSITFDPAEPARCKVDLAIPVFGLRADEPEMQKRAGIDEKRISEDRRAEIEKDMLAEDQLDAKNHPEIQLSSRSTRRG